ncbi:MAG: hypothetical protein ABGX83_04765 [Nitrospira sp.]|nr:hypothetical protein [Candidatus Manganitrophaceae bacterium]HIL35698.1 hypothetical protein [Candidatus Manganitrophaceae bacterium]
MSSYRNLRIKGFWFFNSCTLLLSFSACSPVTEHYVQVDHYLAQEKYSEADLLIEQNQEGYGKKNFVLYNLDRAMTLHLEGRYTESNRFLDVAEQQIDLLYTKSIPGETGAMLTNDNMLPYEGEDFEKAMINVISSLNYVYLGQLDEALVEMRKVDHKLNLLNDKYEQRNIYKEDAFARYLSGILYEAKGELNDAFIAYRKAFETYNDYWEDYGTVLLPTLPGDLLRVTEAIGLTEEFQFYRNKFPNVIWVSQNELDRQAELVFLSYDGLSPIKEDFFIDAPVPNGEGGFYFIRIALPRYINRLTDLVYTNIRLIGPQGEAASQRTFLVEDIEAIANKNLDDRIARITVKAIARATSKYLAAHKIRENTKENSLAKLLADLGTNIYSIVSEQSDKRSWRTLPGKIRMARLFVPPGPYTVSVDYYANAGGLIASKNYQVILKAGEKRFLSHRVLGHVLP